MSADRARRRREGEPRPALHVATRTLADLELEPAVAFARCVRMRAGELARPIELREAMRELLAVHRAEQARLLLFASRLRCAGSAIGRSFSIADALESPLPRRGTGASTGAANSAADCGVISETDWRARTSEEIDACIFDGWEADPRLVECCSRPHAQWRSASALARAAFALERSCDARIALARAELCEGSVDRAATMLGDLYARVPDVVARVDWLENLALAHELRGRWLRAASAHAALLEDRPRTASSLAALVALALRIGDVELAERTLERLASTLAGAAPERAADERTGDKSTGDKRDADTDAADERAADKGRSDERAAGERALENAVLRRIRARVAFHRRAGRWSYSQSARACIDDWKRGGVLRSTVARALS
jgi:hypothetical protein